MATTSTDKYGRLRDTQRGRLYAAEGQPAAEFADLSDCQAFIADRIEGTRWFQARWGARRPQLRPGYGARQAFAWGNKITLPLWARSRQVICHEYAHLLVDGAGYAVHGPEFAGIYVALVEHAISPAAAGKLADAFRAAGVRRNSVGIPSPVRSVAAKTARRPAPPLTAAERATAADTIRRAVKAGLYGPAGATARNRALATARTLETP